MNTEIVYSKNFNLHDNPDHPENAKRTDVMMDALLNSDLNKLIAFVTLNHSFKGSSILSYL